MRLVILFYMYDTLNQDNRRLNIGNQASISDYQQELTSYFLAVHIL